MRDWARVDGDRPAPHRFAARIYEDMGAIDLAAEAAERAAARAPEDADAWERVGRLRLRLMDRAGRDRRARARADASARASRRCSTSRSPTTSPATSAARSPPTEQATHLDPKSAGGLGALRPRARPHRPRVSDAIGAAERALSLNGHDAEVADLLERLRGAEPRVLPAA